MDKVKEQLLKDFKKANQQAKVKLAAKYGFMEPSEYLSYLTGTQAVKKGQSTKSVNNPLQTKKNTPIPTVHLVHLLDCSTSMDQGDKIGSAIEAIKEGVSNGKQEKKVNYRYNLISFSNSGDTIIHISDVEIKDAKVPLMRTRGMTALYEAVGNTLDMISKRRKDGENVLFEVYSDGEENHSKGKYRDAKVLKELIDSCKSKGFTITFIGTDKDVDSVVSKLKISASNTMKYDGTSAGLLKTLRVANTSREVYADKLSKGEDVSLNYFSKELSKL